MGKLAVFVIVAVTLTAIAIGQRHQVTYLILTTLVGETPELLAGGDELATTRWVDDYFTIDEIAPNTFAIGEPRYYQQNYSYLIVGAERALLFDAGPGVRDIKAVAESLTELPILFMPSHFHYDHVGNGLAFAQRLVVDLPYLRERADGDRLAFLEMEHLGPVEGFPVPTWQVDRWLKPGEQIDLGGRSVEVVHTPGHSKESVSILDAANNLVLTGDYLYTGPLILIAHGASMSDYLATSIELQSRESAGTRYFGAHRGSPPGPPVMGASDLDDLQRALLAIRAGELEGSGSYPVEYVINDRIQMLAEPGWLQDW